MLCAENSLLYAAAYRHFGGWRKALKAAGFSKTPRLPEEEARLKSRWTARSVLEKIQEFHAAGRHLPQVRAENHSLYYAALKFFGRWYKAPKAAGIAGTEWQIMRPDVVLENLRNLQKQGHSLRSADATNELRYAAMQHFGNWRKALAQAGLLPEGKLLCSHTWTKAEILHGILAWQKRGRKRGPDLRAHGRLTSAARHHFGSWNSAPGGRRAAAGLHPLVGGESASGN